ncbi:MAG: RIP metalloprotease RseP [Pseudomonadota bacterium]
MELIQTVLAFILALGILVTVHEYGHYLAARLSGVGIVRFSVGFGRPLLSRVDARGTEFAVAAIPLGGYLRMWDERDTTVARPKVGVSHHELHPLWRIFIALAGPLANFVLAAFVFWILFVAGTTEILPVLGKVPDDSPAHVAGLRGGEEIVAVDGVATQGWNDVGMQLVDRLGETGVIRVTTRQPGAERTTDYGIAIADWHRGVNEPPVLSSLGLVPVWSTVVGSLQPDSPAQRAGVQVSDQVVSAAGVELWRWQDFVEIIERSAEQSVALVVRRGGQELSLTVVPASHTLSDGRVIGRVGIGSATRSVRYGPLRALPLALTEVGEKTNSILTTIGKMFTGQVSTRNLSGPITIAQVAGDTIDRGWRDFADLLALLSLSLAILNLLPIPLLDGGQVVFFTAELLRGRPLSERTQVIGVQVGVVLVGALMLLALSNDITRVFGG